MIVTTKKGQQGDKFTVGLTSAYTMDKVAYMPHFQSEYGTGWEGAYDAVEKYKLGTSLRWSIAPDWDLHFPC
ncbi:MAG: hypothetical protein IPF54_24680 [Draconibacterium sp.]|nr:hypothetical protein [Draconibacterium sp.]